MHKIKKIINVITERNYYSLLNEKLKKYIFIKLS
jgi:hypothetical protein